MDKETKITSPEKSQISAALKQLADDMETIGLAMVLYGGVAGAHGSELAGAAKIANSWADEIDSEGLGLTFKEK